MDELVQALRGAGPEPIVQHAVGTAETEYTCGAVVLDGECSGVIAMRRDLRDGNTFRAYLEPASEIEAMIRSVALALNPCGPANFQLRVGKDGPAIFEINARFSGTTVVRALAGFNEVEAVVRWAVSGERVPLVRQKSGVVLRYLEELFVSWEEYQGMGGSCVR
jgi:carbamoyl-phosphate synthase large subunit